MSLEDLSPPVTAAGTSGSVHEAEAPFRSEAPRVGDRAGGSLAGLVLLYTSGAAAAGSAQRRLVHTADLTRMMLKGFSWDADSCEVSCAESCLGVLFASSVPEPCAGSVAGGDGDAQLGRGFPKLCLQWAAPAPGTSTALPSPEGARGPSAVISWGGHACVFNKSQLLIFSLEISIIFSCPGAFMLMKQQVNC